MHLLGFAPVGAYAERVAVPEKDCYVLPSSMPFSDAAAMGIAYQTAHIALLDRGQLRRGETVLINGAAGGVGLAAVQVAKAKGAVVLAGLTTLTKAEVVRASGADYVIDLTQSDLAKSLRDQVFAVTGGRGANVVIDLIGGDVFDASMRALAWRGRAVVIGFVSNRIPVIKTNYLLIKNVSASGLFWDSYRREASDEVRAVQEDLFALYTAGKIKPVIMEALPLEQIGRAFGRITRREVVGRVLLDPTA
jgi:NADPH2:quinone reductase